MKNNIFDIGDIITLKSHPLAYQDNGEIDAYINQIPPLMCIKEVHIEKTKQIFSSENSGLKIADNIKYLCVYFNQHRMIFEEGFVYQDTIISIKDITFHNKNDEIDMDHEKLIDETIDYKDVDYEFGKRIFFKTYKLEKRKKFSG